MFSASSNLFPLREARHFYVSQIMEFYTGNGRLGAAKVSGYGGADPQGMLEAVDRV